MRFGLFFSGSNEKPADLGESQYALVLHAARFADRNAFAFVSTPERHFSRAGALFPNPALTSAALAVTTTGIQVRAGCVTSPLHDPVRLVEDWSVVDLLSGGRVALGLDCGWDVDEFALAPDAYGSRRASMYRQVEEIRSLWRARRSRRPNGAGAQVDLTVYPEPVSGDLPVWVAVSRDPQAFVEAGRMGANVLTHLVDQDLLDLADHVDRYRDARSVAGLDGDGVVTVMQHTFVSDDPEDVDAAAALLAAQALRGRRLDPVAAAARHTRRPDLDVLPPRVPRGLAHRTPEEHALVGSVAACTRAVRQLERAGADEVACVVDFVTDPDLLRRGLPGLAALRRAFDAHPSAAAPRPPADRFLGWG